MRSRASPPGYDRARRHRGRSPTGVDQGGADAASLEGVGDVQVCESVGTPGPVSITSS
jgi:hypothetical protein